MVSILRFIIMDTDDIQDSADEQHLDLNNLCWVEDGWISFAAYKGGPFNIELSRIATYQKLAWWTRHLAGKPWMSLPMLRHFMRLVCEHHGMDYRGSL